MMSMDSLGSANIQILVGVAVAVVAVGVGAAYLYSSKKPRGQFSFKVYSISAFTVYRLAGGSYVSHMLLF